MTALSQRSVIAVGAGNALGFYDFLTYAFFAVQIGHCFFPGGASRSLLLSLGTFGAGFLMRPLGGLVLGLYADRAGRRPAMVLSFWLMGAGVAGLACTPPASVIGTAAPVLLLGWRLLQGFALGGEVGPSTAYLMEAAPPGRRGFVVSLQYAAQDLAILVAGSAGFALSRLLSPAALDAWGWRVAFGLGVGIVPFGIWLRRGLPETFAPAAAGVARRTPSWRVALLGLGFLGCGTIVGYGFNYMTTFAQDSLHLPPAAAFGATMVLGVVLVTTDVASGWLSDIVGRRRLLLAAVGLLLLTVVPLFQLMVRFPQPMVVYAATAWFGVLEAFVTVPGLVLLAEMLPPETRSASLGTIYAVAVALFGGTTQFMMKVLGLLTGSPLAPAYYVTAAVCVGAVAAWRLPAVQRGIGWTDAATPGGGRGGNCAEVQAREGAG